VSAVVFGALIAAVTAAHLRLRLGAVLAFWIAYVLTPPFGASIGDYLSQPRSAGGLGLGTTVTTFLFLGTILVVVAFLTLTRRDVTEAAGLGDPPIRDPCRPPRLVDRERIWTPCVSATPAARRTRLLVSDARAGGSSPARAAHAEIDVEGSVSTRRRWTGRGEPPRGSLRRGHRRDGQHRLSRPTLTSHRLGHVGVPVTTVVG
jgi:hypothetical protein